MREAERVRFEQRILLEHTTTGAVDRLGKPVSLLCRVDFLS